MESKRIAFVIYSLGSGGAERVVTELANNMVNEYEVTIITLIKTTPFYTLSQKVNLLYCSEIIKENANVFRSLYDGLSRVRKVSEYLKKFRIQLVISFMTSSNIYAIWATKLARIPCIISERANHNIYQLPPLLIKIRDFSYKYCQYLVVQTEGNKAFYARKLPSDKILVIPNPVGDSLKNKRDSTRKSDGKKKILNVGSFKPGKAQELLIAAFSAIPNLNWQVVFAGEGPTKEQKIALSQSLGISEKIHFLGKKSNIHEYYNEASIFVFTSEHEGFPNALLEALYFGVPTISTNCPHGPADLITDGENGFLIPVGNQKKLEKRLIELMTNVDLQNKFSKNAILSTKKFELELIAAKWKKYINQLL